MSPLDAPTLHAVRRLLIGRDMGGELAAIPLPYRPIVGDLADADPEDRPDVWDRFLDFYEPPDRDRINVALAAVDPDGPIPEAGTDPDDEEPIGPPPWPEAPEAAAYDGLAGDIIRRIEPHTEADPVAILGQLLVGFGNLIGRTAYAVADGSRHFANENVVIVGDSSKARKGTSLAHSRNRLEAVDPEWANTQITSGLSSGEGLIHAVRDDQYRQEPVREGKKIIDYQRVMVDPGVEDKRLLVVESEFGGTLQTKGREGNTLSALIRQAWDSGTLRTLTRNDPQQATGAHVSIVGHITREELVSLLGRTDSYNGFANRFLWLSVRRSKLLPLGGAIEIEDFTLLDDRLREAAEAARNRREMRFDAKAEQLWSRTYPHLSEGRPGLLGAVTSRSEAHTLRLALIYALLDCSPVIGEQHLRSALALWWYAERSAAHIFGDSLGDPDADTLLEALRSAPEGLTRSEIRDGVFQRNKPSKRIKEILGTLAAANLAHARTEATGGRPAQRWFAGQEGTR